MNLHDELGRHGADAVEDSARRLSSSDVRSSLSSRVRRGRRRRAVAGGVGAVAGIALVAVGAWAVLPGLGVEDAQPADRSASIDADLRAKGTVYDVDGSAPVGPVGPIDVRRSQSMVCGTPFDLDEGVTVHDTSVIAHGVTLAALSAQSSTQEDATEVDASEQQQVFESQVVTDGKSNTTWTSVPLLLHDGEIVSIGVGMGGTGWEDEPSRMWTPNPGACGTAGSSDEYADGIYEPVLVTQFWSSSLQDPLATVVFSAGEVEYTGLGEPAAEGPSDSDGRPALGTDGYLANHNMAVQSGDFSCTGTLQVKDVGDPNATGEGSGSLPVPIPSWIETGRLYGYGDDVLVGGYPIPLGPDAVGPADAIVAGEARLILNGESGDSWVFDARWSERDDLPHDEPGWFVELGQVWDCGSPDLIEPGEYEARLLYEGPGTELPFTAVLKPVTIVDGVPSLPEIDEQG